MCDVLYEFIVYLLARKKFMRFCRYFILFMISYKTTENYSFCEDISGLNKFFQEEKWISYML